MEFWREDCPSRGPTLTHAHWNDCIPSATHPGSADRHPSDMCCHCGFTPTTWRAYELAEAEQNVREDAPLALPQPVGDCPSGYTHLAKPALMIGDEGWTWSRCAGCHAILEPAMATGKAVGPPWGRGRGWISPRMERRWMEIAYRFAGRLG